MSISPPTGQQMLGGLDVEGSGINPKRSSRLDESGEQKGAKEQEKSLQWAGQASGHMPVRPFQRASVRFDGLDFEREEEMKESVARTGRG